MQEAWEVLIGRQKRARERISKLIFIEISTGREKKVRVSRLGLANLNNSSALWGMGAVPSCMVPGVG